MEIYNMYNFILNIYDFARLSLFLFPLHDQNIKYVKLHHCFPNIAHIIINLHKPFK